MPVESVAVVSGRCRHNWRQQSASCCETV